MRTTQRERHPDSPIGHTISAAVMGQKNIVHRSFVVCIVALFGLLTFSTALYAAAPTKCTVIAADGLNLRAAPGTQYSKIARLLKNTTVTPSATISNAQWLLVRSGALEGWVSTNPAWLTCNGDITQLPRKADPTPIPTPTATPFQVAYTPLPGGGGNDDELVSEGTVTEQGLIDENNTFRNRIYFRLIVRTTAPNAKKDSDGIRRVRFRIQNNNGDVVYDHTEQGAPYCSFGGQDGCRVLDLKAGVFWPPSDNADQVVPVSPILNGDYDGRVFVYTDDSDDETGSWNFNFSINAPALPGNANATNQIDFFVNQIGEESTDTFVTDAVVFEFFASTGEENGAGIEWVDFWLFDAAGRQVYHKGSPERTPPYCAFGGNERCEVYDFAAHDDHWPNGTSIRVGMYTLVAVVKANNGAMRAESVQIEIQ